LSKPKRENQPNPDDWAWLAALAGLGDFDDDFMAAINEELPQQERPEVDAFFNSLLSEEEEAHGE
jgi:hypothetical protein